MAVDQDILAGGAMKTTEVALSFKDGRQRTIRTTKGPLFDEAGRAYGVFGIGRNITHHQEIERQLQQIESRFRSLIHNSPDITTVLSAEGSVVYESPASYRVFGWTEVQAVGRNALQMIHPDDREKTMKVFAAALAAPEETHSAQFRFRKADGTYVLLEASGQSRLDDPDIAGVVVNSRDVTERHRLWEQLRQAQKMEAIGRLAWGIAHDFNNLLTVISGYSEVVLASPDLAHPIRKPLEEVRKAGNRAAQLTNQLLAFGRQRVFKPTSVDLNTTILNLVAILPRLIGEYVHLTTSLHPNVGYVISDTGQLEQVVMNLAINARDAMPEGGTLTIETSPHVRSPLISLTVRDTGHGMDADTLSRIFEPCYTTKAPGRGTGLGLAMVYGIVSQSGGTIDVSSTPDQGTIFVLSFPRAETPQADSEAAGALTSVPFGSETVLLVEDEMMVRAFARDVLAARGYRVLEASSGEEVLQLYAKDDAPVDLLLTDIVMPGINGRELAERMVALRPSLKVLFMSGYTEDVSLRSARWQAVSLLQKPFGVDALERGVRQTLDREPNSGP